MLNKKRSLFFTIAALVVFLVIGFQIMNSVSREYKAQEQSSNVLKEVDSKNVCMVTDKLFDKEQIAVEVEGKTYYGCCEMCKGRLANDPDIRLGTDPLSKKKVDKSQSIIAASTEGDIYYFESKENLKKFNKIKNK